MAPHHEPLKALSPVDWDDISETSLDDFVADVLSNAQTVIDSLPVPAPIQSAAAAGGSNRRARSHTDPPLPSSAVINRSLSTRQSGAAITLARDLMKEWKEVKVSARENPLAINVYKLAAKDGRGTWFARRSIHDGLTFEKWKLGLEREFVESMKVQTGPGGGSIRGIGAEKRAEHHVCNGAGKAEVFQLSAQFPGPTAPRDFVTLLLSSDDAIETTTKEGQRPLRSYMIVSKPCNHPDCPPRQGYIRGQYESVELVREVPTDKPAMRRARSSLDVGSEEYEKRQSMAEDLGREAVLRAAKRVASPDDSRQRGKSVDSAPAARGGNHKTTEVAVVDEDDVPTTIEWLMITRSDPGGNVPRFMIERGTPGGIVGDANKFLKWLTSKAAGDFTSGPGDENDQQDDLKKNAVAAEETKARTKSLAPAPTANLVADNSVPPEDRQESEPSEVPSSNGLYGMISGAFGYASSAVAGRLPSTLPGFFHSGNNSSNEAIPEEDDNEDKAADDISHESDTSSIRSFASAMEGTEETPSGGGGSSIAASMARDDVASTHSDESSFKNGLQRATTTQHEKELKKLQDRGRKVREKMTRMQSRLASKRAEESQKDAAALAKQRERHEREVAKQEEKYQRELRRIEEKKEQAERKAEERRRKQAEREEKANLNVELDKTRAERDLALRQIEVLKAQVGELQSQNTMLVAEMGRRTSSGAGGLKRQDSTWSKASTAADRGENGSKGQREVAAST